MSNIEVGKTLVDYNKVVQLLAHPMFIQMVTATVNKQKEVVQLLSNTLEHEGYKMEEIVCALSNVRHGGTIEKQEGIRKRGKSN